MAGGRREYELLFKLKAAVGPDFNATFKNAVDTQKRLADSTKQINSLQSKIDGYQKAAGAIDSNKSKLESLTQAHDRLQAELQETANRKKALQKAMETAEADGNIEDYKRLQSELTSTQREYDRLKDKLNGNKSQIQQTTARIEEQQRSLNNLGQELQDAGVNTDNLEGANKRLQKSYEKLKSAQENLKNINETQERLNKSISGTKLQLAGAIGGATGLAAAFYAGPVKSAQAYETALAKVSTIADTQAVPLDKISKAVMELSNTTGVEATAIAEDVYNAISAGQQTGDAVNFVSNSTKLAKAGFAETSQTLDVLTTILNAYGKSADEVGSVSDMLIQIQNKGKVTVGELSSVMGKIIPTANSYNVSMEQLGATYAIMTSKGIAAAETTTYANSMLNELGKSGTTADKTLRKVAGKGFSDLMASGMSLGDVLAILQDAAAKNGKTLADMFGSAEAGKAAVSLLSNGVDGFNASVQDMLNSAGATDAAFSTMAGTTDAKMQKAKNSIANLGIVLGQNLLPVIGDVADKAADLITKISTWAQENPQLVQTIGKVLAGLAGMKIAGLGAKLGFLEIFSGVNKARGVLATLKINTLTAGITKMGKAANPIGGILGKMFGTAGKGISTMLAPLGNIAGKVFSPITKGAAAVSKGIKTVLGPIDGIASKIFGPMGKVISTALGPLGGIAGKILPIVGVITAVVTAVQLFREHLNEIRGLVGKAFGKAGLEVFDKIVAAVTLAGDTIRSVFSDGNLGSAREKIEEIFGSKGAAVFDSFINILRNVQAIVGGVIDFITLNVVPVANDILAVITGSIIPMIVNAVQAAAPTVMQIIQTVTDFIGGIIPVIGNFIAGLMPVISEVVMLIETNVLPIVQEVVNFIVSEALPFIAQGLQGIASTVMSVISTVLPIVQQAISTIWTYVGPFLEGLLTAVQAALPSVLNIFRTVFSTIGTVVQSVMQVFGGLIQFITGVFTGNWSKAWEGIKSIFSGIWNGLTGIVKGIINGIINAINAMISGLNTIKIPDWVPGVGGKGINIPLIPTFAKGTKNTPPAFITGEEGPELVTDAPHRIVYTAEQTRQIMSRSQRAAADVSGIRETPARLERSEGFRNAPTVSREAAGGRTYNITLNNSPTIVVQGGTADDLDARLQENNARLLRDMKDAIRQQQDDEARAVYE